MRAFPLPVLSTLLVLPAMQAFADVDVRVGAGAGCSTSNIQLAINGANPANGVTNILIARNVAYNAQQLDINGRNVRLIGGFADCSQILPDATKTIINGAGGSANTVITVRGATATVAFQNLEVAGGDEVTTSAGRGGGFAIAGGPHAHVAFDNVLIDNNQAGYGGGIYVDNEHSSTAADVFVEIGSNVAINGNHGAYGGGGIWCRNARVHMIGSNSFVVLNTTSAAAGVLGPGGGIRAQNCEMDIASAGAFGSVSLNTAGGAGGGLSVTGERSITRLYTQVPSRPVSINGNTAGGIGGGIDIGSSAIVTGWDLVVDGNRSYAGGGGVSIFDNDGAYVDRARLTMLGRLVGAPNDPATGGIAVLCATGLACNRVSNNIARNTDGQAMPAAALRAQADGSSGPAASTGFVEADLQGTRLTANAGESLLRLYSPSSGIPRVSLNGAVVSANAVTGTLLHNPDDPFAGQHGILGVYATTVAGNDIGGGEVIRSVGREGLLLLRSIVWQPGKRAAVSTDGQGFFADSIDYVLGNDLTGLPSSAHNLQQDPRFENAAAGNFRTQRSSPAVDVAPLEHPAWQPDFLEADNAARVVDLVSVPDAFGAQDLGAFERAFDCAQDTIFCHDFEP